MISISITWKVTVVDTGLNTMTGGRIKRIQKYVGNEPFMMTYGDGVCDVDINKLVKISSGTWKNRNTYGSNAGTAKRCT